MYRSTTTIMMMIMISSILITVDAQGISHYSQSGGGKPGLVSAYLTGDALTATQGLGPKQRYDWSWCRLHLRDTSTGFEAFSDFHPRVDEFSSLRILNSNKTMIFAPNMTIWLEFPGNVSVVTQLNKQVTCDDGAGGRVPQCANISTPTYTETVNVTTYQNIILPPKKIFEVKPNDLANTPYIVNFFTAIVQLDKGVITSAAWDGDRDTGICKDCDYCIDNQCAVKASTMQCDQTGCNLKIFLAWAGVDSQNKPCISIGKIPSAFRKYSSTPLSQLGMGLVGDFLSKVVGNTNNPNTA